MISKKFQKTGDHRRVFDFSQVFGSGGGGVFDFTNLLDPGVFFYFHLFPTKDGTGGYEKNQITALTLVQIHAPCVSPIGSLFS